MSETDFASMMVPIAQSFWGEPNAAMSNQREIRWGSGGGRAVNVEKGVWTDWTSGANGEPAGGGVLDLVMQELGCEKREALEWLESEGYIQPREDRSASQPRQESREAVRAPEPPPEEEEAADELTGEWVAVKGYRYTNRDGEPVYEVIRKHFRMPDGTWKIDPKTGNPAKTFGQRHKGPDGHYINTIKGIPHTIYRHPEVERAIAENKPIFLVEGEKDVETVEALGLVGTTNSGGAGNWRPDLAEIFRGADVVIMVDNDDVGRTAGEARAKSLRGIAARIRVLDFAEHVPDFPAKGDVSDWVAKGGSSQVLEAIVASLQDWRQARPISKFNATGLGDVDKQAAKHSWLVQDMIELMGTASFAGFTQSGKSFLMIDLAFCVARGTPFWGRPVTQGLVIYQVGEGELGFFKRVQGYQQDRGFVDDKSIPIEFLPKKINLFVDDKDTEALIAECKALEEFHGVKLRLVVIDTLNKATRGSNEISGQDNGKIIERVERVARECQCTVIVVDHLSMQGRLRGHTSKSDDMTNVIKVSAIDKVDQNNRTIRKFVLDKNKDGEKGGETFFVLRQVTTGFDDLGRPITTCVVDSPDGDVASEVAKGHMSMSQALLLRTVKDSAEIEGEAAPPELVQVPPGRNVAKWVDVVARAKKTWAFSSSDPAKREQELSRALKDAGNRLYMARYIDRDNSRGLIWWTGKTDYPSRKLVEAKVETKSPLMTKEDIDVPF